MPFKKGNIPWNKFIKTIVYCHYCNKEIKIQKCRLKYNKRFYCNINCRTKDWIGKGNPLYGKIGWNKGLTKENNKSLKSLSEKMKGKNNPMFKKRSDTSGMNFYFEDIGHRCRSSWEVNIARVLKYNNIKYEYEPKTFNLKKSSYTPDFYLNDLNLYIEVKGWYNEEFKKKLNRFKLEYPNIYILVIDEDIYNKIILKFKDKIDYESSCKLKKSFKFKEVKIKKITKTNYSPKKVYNLTIEDDNSFIVNGLVVHNTAPHWTSVNNLKKWCKDKWGDENLAYILQRVISKKGTRPSHFIKESVAQELTPIIAEALQQKDAITITR